MKVGVTCIQLIRDLEGFRPALEEAGIEVVAPSVPGQFLVGDALVEALAGCDGVVAGDDRFTADVLERLPGLRAIAKWGIGVDSIDFEAAERLGIEVTNTPGEFAAEVADVTLAYVVMLARGLHLIDRGVRAGGWPKPAGRSLASLSLGILGLGNIGRAVAARGLFLGMHVLGSDPSPMSVEAARQLGVEVVETDDLFGGSDVIAVAAPHNDSTHHLVGYDAFSRMRPGTLLVNTGRGPVVDTAALVEALENGTIAGAALDVLEDEPPGPDHPLLRFDGVVFGSHNASNTLEASDRVHRRAITNLASSLGVEVRLK